MLGRIGRLAATAGALAIAGGCVSPTGGRQAASIAAEGQVAGGGVGAAVSVGALAGTMRGPAPGLIADNAASVLSNNAGGLISNNGGGLISDRGAGYRLAHVDDLTTPAAGVEVTVVDAEGGLLSTKPAKTDKDGHFRLTGLKAAAGVVFVQASYRQEGHPVTLLAAVAVAGGAGQPIAVDPATTLVARKLGERLRRGEVRPEAVKAAPLASETAAFAAAMNARAVAAAAILPADAAERTYDAMLAQSRELAGAIAERPASGASGAPPSSAAPASPRPSASAATSAPVASASPTASPPAPAASVRPNGRVVTSLAGTGAAGVADGPAAAATFSRPWGLAVERDGGVLVCDSDSNRLRRVTAAGTVSTVATDFAHPQGVAVDATGAIFVADRDRHRIARVAPNGAVTTFVGNGSAALADGLGAEAAFNEPAALVFDQAGAMYVADSHNHCIRKVTPDGRVSLFAGDGVAGTRDGLGAAARLTHPSGLAIDAGGTLYAGEEGTGKVRKIGPDGRVSTLGVTFGQALGLAVDQAGMLYVADHDRHVIRRVTPEGVAEDFAGDGVDRFRNGTGPAASFDGPSGLAFDRDGRLFVTDLWNHRVRRVE